MTRRSYVYVRVFFAHNGPGPYECFACGEEVELPEVTVHHLDHNPFNNDLANLAPAHKACHSGYHSRERWATFSPEERRAQSQKVREARWAAPLKAHCVHGHPYDEENTYITSKGHRQCRQCVRDAGARYRERKLQEAA
jgi:hypothetical protein